MRKSLKFFALLTVFITPQAFSAFECRVSLNAVLIYANGSVNVNHAGRNDYTVICNTKEERLGVSIATCALWASMLLNIKQAGGKADFYYETTPGVDSCSSLPTYSASPAPVYIGKVL